MYDAEELQKKLGQVSDILFGEKDRYRNERMVALERIAANAREYQRTQEYCERMSRWHPESSLEIVHGWIRNARTAESNLFYALSQLKELEEDHK